MEIQIKRFKTYLEENNKIFDKYAIDPDKKAKLFKIWITVSDLQDITEIFAIPDPHLGHVEHDLNTMRERKLFERKDHFVDPFLLNNIKNILIKYKGLIQMENINLKGNKLYNKKDVLEEINDSLEYIELFLASSNKPRQI